MTIYHEEIKCFPHQVQGSTGEKNRWRISVDMGFEHFLCYAFNMALDFHDRMQVMRPTVSLALELRNLAEAAKTITKDWRKSYTPVDAYPPGTPGVNQDQLQYIAESLYEFTYWERLYDSLTEYIEHFNESKE